MTYSCLKILAAFAMTLPVFAGSTSSAVTNDRPTYVEGPHLYLENSSPDTLVALSQIQRGQDLPMEFGLHAARFEAHVSDIAFIIDADGSDPSAQQEQEAIDQGATFTEFLLKLRAVYGSEWHDLSFVCVESETYFDHVERANFTLHNTGSGQCYSDFDEPGYRSFIQFHLSNNGSFLSDNAPYKITLTFIDHMVWGQDLEGGVRIVGAPEWENPGDLSSHFNSLYFPQKEAVTIVFTLDRCADWNPELDSVCQFP